MAAKARSERSGEGLKSLARIRRTQQRRSGSSRVARRSPDANVGSIQHRPRTHPSFTRSLSRRYRLCCYRRPRGGERTKREGGAPPLSTVGKTLPVMMAAVGWQKSVVFCHARRCVALSLRVGECARGARRTRCQNLRLYLAGSSGLTVVAASSAR
jgi:hypothetical protein